MKIKKNYIFKFNKDVIKRYETDLNGGTVFIYNVNNKNFWMGNNAAYKFIEYIDGVNSVEKIYNFCLSEHPTNCHKFAIKNFDRTLKKLINLKFISY